MPRSTRAFTFIFPVLVCSAAAQPVITSSGLSEIELIAQTLVMRFDELDVSGDGGLSIEEARMAFSDLVQFAFDDLDADGDALLSESELVNLVNFHLCTIRNTLNTLLEQFRQDFGPLDADLDDDGVPEHFLVEFVAFGACDDTAYSVETVNAFEMNRALYRAVAGKQTAVLADYANVLAVLSLASQQSQDALAEVLMDFGFALPAGLETVVCDDLGVCSPALDAASDEKGALNEPYAGAGDYDLDGVTNAEELDNVLDAGRGVEEFVSAATDPTTAGPMAAGCGTLSQHLRCSPFDAGLLALVFTLLFKEKVRPRKC